MKTKEVQDLKSWTLNSKKNCKEDLEGVVREVGEPWKESDVPEAKRRKCFEREEIITVAAEWSEMILEVTGDLEGAVLLE